MTSPAEEREEQKRWRLRPQYQRMTAFNELIDSEFLGADENEARLSGLLQRMLRFTAAAVPYYQRAWREAGIDGTAIRDRGDLAALPVIDRDIIKTRGRELQPARLPPGEFPGGPARTSGSTGQPITVQHSRRSQEFFAFLKQREYRWWRLDPAGRLASVRAHDNLPTLDGRYLADGESMQRPAWPVVGHFFVTGDAVFANETNPFEWIADWLREQQPDVVLAMAAVLECIALEFTGRPPPAGVRAAISISQQLTPAMADLVRDRLGVPIFQNYGLNEIGLVAAQCPESGYFHVHNEHCLVEIVDRHNRPCAPGESGRILVTGLVNAAMPLIRYDTDDLAVMPESPCPCGRGLQSFTGLRGRYRRISHLPAGTWACWDSLVVFFTHGPAELIRQVRQYQLHQHADGSFTLRLRLAGPLQGGLEPSIRAVWDTAGGESPPALAIELVEQIPRHGRKLQDFISDFAPPE